MIVVTGAAGFIGSNLVHGLNQQGYHAVVAVDDFSNEEKLPHLANARLKDRVHRDEFFDWLVEHQQEVEFVFHLGARTDTTEFDKEIFDRLNVSYSQRVWELCVKYQLPLVYASSAATYGGGEHGYADDESEIEKLQPLNPYGQSKQDFDVWALAQPAKPFFWAGLKFFNVYGPHEDHKGRMASVVYHAYHQIRKTGGMKLFRSHHPEFKDGEQLRDFIFVGDLVAICLHFMHERKPSGIYNVGTGTARTFLDLTRAVFAALDKEPNISFVDTPEDIRDKYQYYTQATVDKLRAAGFDKPFTPLEKGVEQYVQEYLMGRG